MTTSWFYKRVDDRGSYFASYYKNVEYISTKISFRFVFVSYFCFQQIYYIFSVTYFLCLQNIVLWLHFTNHKYIFIDFLCVCEIIDNIKGDSWRFEPKHDCVFVLFLLCRINAGQNIICWMVNSVYTTSWLCDFNRNERLRILNTTCSLYQLDFSLGA